MQRLTRTNPPAMPSRNALVRLFRRRPAIYLTALFLAGTLMITLSACGGGASDPPQSTSLAGNWQFSLTNTSDLTATSGLQGGFILQNNQSVSGGVVYINTLANSVQGPCSSGSTPITGSINGQSVILTAVAGTQTFTLTGTVSGSTMTGTYTATAGTAADGTACGNGTGQSALAWSAVSVPPLTGSITGSFHSSSGYNSGLGDQDFAVTGTFTQGQNIGASNATVTGTLSFIDPTTNLSDYPCVPSGLLYVNGQISGNTVVLQLVGSNGANVGQIGIANSQVNSVIFPVTFDSTTQGYVLHSKGTGYVVNTSACPAPSRQDGGYLCLALNSTAACQQPITLSPAFATFPSQLLGSTNPSTQTITLTNTQPAGSMPLTGLTLMWAAASGVPSDAGQTDFTGVANLTAADTCVPETLITSGGTTSVTGAPFSLAAGQSCTITVSFAPQAGCTWLPNNGGTPPAQCPLSLTATLTANNVPSVDPDTNFSIPITATGLSFVQSSTPELDFGSEAIGESSLPQLLSFINNGVTPVQILPKAPCTNTSFSELHTLPRPLELGSPVAGLQVLTNLQPDVPVSILYACDYDLNTLLPNFQISSDTCSGALLAPQGECSLQIAFIPQSVSSYSGPLDYFLELNTYQCADPVNDPPSPANPCELDAGRFPVELKANLPSPLRMSPAAGISFGNMPVGKSSLPQDITLLNDPNLTCPPSSQQCNTVSFVGKFSVSGNYSETDNCPSSLAAGDSCVVSITFKPSSTGYRAGSVAINYTTGSNSALETQSIFLRGTGQ
jgi:hypothetical protein